MEEVFPVASRPPPVPLIIAVIEQVSTQRFTVPLAVRVSPAELTANKFTYAAAETFADVPVPEEATTAESVDATIPLPR